MRVPLIGGAYAAQSVIADAQRCINLYPERNQKDAPSPVTHYPTPGLLAFGSPPVAGAGRGLWASSRNTLFSISGTAVYSVSAGGVLTQIGEIPYGTTPVAMVDNGISMLICDGSPNSWEVDLATGVFSQNTDPNFQGAGRLDYLDTFVLGSLPGTQAFTSSLSNELIWDPTYIANKTANPDLLQGLAVAYREIWLIGQLTSEIWYDAGNPGFPFAIMQGPMVEHGTCSGWSISKLDINVYWVSQDKQGQRMVFRGAGYRATRISNHALEYALSQMPTCDDTVSYTYQQGGHNFVVFNFPAGDQTWVWDEAAESWHQRTWLDGNGVAHRHRVQFAVAAFQKNIGQDWQTGQLYELDLETYTDVGASVQRVRSFPHMFVGMGPNGPIPSDGKLVRWNAFMADMETGTAPGVDAKVFLRWSNDRGVSWGNPVARHLGYGGKTLTNVLWRNTGTARDRVFELSWSSPIRTALNGAFVDPMVLGK